MAFAFDRIDIAVLLMNEGADPYATDTDGVYVEVYLLDLMRVQCVDSFPDVQSMWH